jgi:hypothetical protein
MADLVLPVGQLMGAPADSAPTQIRVGGTLHQLSPVDFQAWMAALTGSSVHRQQSLVEQGLLAVVPTEGPGAYEFARSHRIVPTVMGLGNSPDDPQLYSIGLFGEELAQVGRAVFELWAWSCIEPNLWIACTTFASLERDAGETEAATTDPARVLCGLMAALPDLLHAQVSFLDRAEG